MQRNKEYFVEERASVVVPETASRCERFVHSKTIIIFIVNIHVNPNENQIVGTWWCEWRH